MFRPRSVHGRGLRIGDTSSLVVVILTQIAMIPVISQVGALSNRVGRKPILVAVAVGLIVLSVPDDRAT
jgi:MHS family proline/betaine transporter-like MFS transporter